MHNYTVILTFAFAMRQIFFELFSIVQKQNKSALPFESLP